MMRSLAEHFEWTELTIYSLLFFVLVFVGVMVWCAFGLNKDGISKRAQLPFDEQGASHE